MYLLQRLSSDKRIGKYALLIDRYVPKCYKSTYTQSAGIKFVN